MCCLVSQFGSMCSIRYGLLVAVAYILPAHMPEMAGRYTRILLVGGSSPAEVVFCAMTFLNSSFFVLELLFAIFSIVFAKCSFASVLKPHLSFIYITQLFKFNFNQFIFVLLFKILLCVILTQLSAFISKIHPNIYSKINCLHCLQIKYYVR